MSSDKTHVNDDIVLLSQEIATKNMEEILKKSTRTESTSNFISNIMELIKISAINFTDVAITSSKRSLTMVFKDKQTVEVINDFIKKLEVVTNCRIVYVEPDVFIIY